LSKDDLSPDVRSFIAEHVDSVVQLEVLLLVHAQHEREWSADDVSNALRINRMWAEEQLANLARRGIVVCTDKPCITYRYVSGRFDATVTKLAQAYNDRRVTIISIISSKPVDKIRTFADAFRLRKDKSDG
jgi:hypothetical protein